MNFVVDESVDRQIVEKLRDDGHSTWYVAEISPSISPLLPPIKTNY